MKDPKDTKGMQEIKDSTTKEPDNIYKQPRPKESFNWDPLGLFSTKKKDNKPDERQALRSTSLKK